MGFALWSLPVLVVDVVIDDVERLLGRDQLYVSVEECKRRTIETWLTMEQGEECVCQEDRCTEGVIVLDVLC